MSGGEVGEGAPPFRGFRSNADDTPRVRDEAPLYDALEEDDPGYGAYGSASGDLVLHPSADWDEAPAKSGALVRTAGVACVVLAATAAGFALTRGMLTPKPVPATAQLALRRDLAPASQPPRHAEPAVPPIEVAQAVAPAKPVRPESSRAEARPAVQSADPARTARPLPRFVDPQASTDVSASAPAPPEVAPPPQPAAATVRPSFDCRTAETPAQQMICNDPRLAAADRRMSRAYAAALAAGAPADELRAEQADWLEIREDAARYSGRAVLDIYRQRTRELEALSEGGPE